MSTSWFAKRKPLQTVPVGIVVFRSEQDGAPERDLKSELSEIFQSRYSAESAYLAVVSYERDTDQSIALCITGVNDRDRAGIVQAVSKIFARIFGVREHLDVLFPTDVQREQLRQVCKPFFMRPLAEKEVSPEQRTVSPQKGRLN